MKIAPSILTADFTDLKKEIDSIKSADMAHIDIMDGHFVPNISFGPAITKQISEVSMIPLDVHLMVSNPCQWIKGFSFNHTKYITVHYEASDFEKAMMMIKEQNIKVGLSIKPGTKVEVLLPYLDKVDLILIMTVEPGFGGQSFMFDMMDKVRYLKNIRQEKQYHYEIEIDGGVNDQTILIAKEAGVDISVVGSYLFNQENREKVISDLR